MAKDFYQILGVSKSASADEVKAAFRKLAHQYHPDKQGGDATKFKEVNEAYQVLSDKEKRARYDQFGSADPGAGFGGFDPSGFHGGNVDFGDLGDIFGSFFGGGRGQREARGNDIELALDISFEESAFGANKEMSFHKHVRCERCAGDGVEPGHKMKDCGTCGGKGRVQAAVRTIFGTMQTARPCDACSGRGKIPEKNCTTCSGAGMEKKLVTLSVKIPLAADDGGIIKLRGQGEAGPFGAPAGDLYVHLRVKPHKIFTREGNVIFSELRLGFTQVALGGMVRVPTLHGDVELKIPAGTQTGTQFRLRGKGVGGGDHLVTAVVITPSKLTREQKKLLEDLDLREHA